MQLCSHRLLQPLLGMVDACLKHHTAQWPDPGVPSIVKCLPPSPEVKKQPHPQTFSFRHQGGGIDFFGSSQQELTRSPRKAKEEEEEEEEEEGLVGVAWNGHGHQRTPELGGYSAFQN